MFENQYGKRLTIEDIETKQFRLAARGYEQREVDEFLDSVCDEMELLQTEAAEMQRKLDMANAELRKAQAAGGVVPPAAAMDESVQGILGMAQRMKEQTVADAQKQADDIIANARSEAHACLGDLEEERQRLEDEVDELRDLARSYREQLGELLRTHQEALDRIEIGRDD